jgi:hypothetical protein
MNTTSIRAVKQALQAKPRVDEWMPDASAKARMEGRWALASDSKGRAADEQA